MPRSKQRMTAVEKLIVLAIIGILLSILMPNLQRARRPVSRARPAAHAVSRRGHEPAGQLNTIKVTELSGGRRREGPQASTRGLGTVLRTALSVVAIIAVISGYRRYLTKRAQQ
jgi:hypothetical protein